MCGIIGYIGHRETSSLLIEGLKRLEYRGYDSAGVAILCNNEIKIVKQKGYIRELEKHLDSQVLKGSLGIGHTRWATHGVPSKQNAHPHLDCQSEIALAHNGIIENFLSLREELEKKGHRFVSETDTEVIVHLIEENYEGDLFEAVKKSLPQLKGSFAFVAISRLQPDEFVAARQDSPLVLGIGEDEYFVASDIPALLKHTKDVIILENGEMVLATRQGFKICKFDGTPCQKKVIKVKWDAEAAEKSGFEDFMLKEIFEQSQGIKETLRGRITSSKGLSKLDEGELSSDEIKNLERILVIACGTSYFAGLTSRSSLEAWVKLPVEVEISSEFRYREAFLTPRTLVVAITQSGETADTLAGMREAQKRGAKVVAVTNVVGSTAAREADGVIYTHAGPEIGVAATKTLTAQITALLILSLFLAQERRSLKKAKINAILSELGAIPAKVEQVLQKADEIKKLAQKFASFEDFLYLGRGVGLPVALEGALKLKEISYIHAEGYPAGEMKHGPIALIDEKMPVVVIATKSHVYEKVLSNIEEVKARRGKVIAIATEGDEEIDKIADHVIFIPETIEMLSPLLAVIPLQLFAYYIAKIRGCNVDQPRNLAKSVTVE
jgi:glucosamine--fructose-6-phosphate aminotransferase (isomerizing)